MSKVFKRPMFRKGGEVGGGIMTGVSDRKNFEVGGSATERLMQVMKDYPVQTVDPVAQLLIQGGLSGFSETGGGSTFGNLAKAFEPATQKFFENIGAQDKAKRDLAIAGTQLDIEQDQAKEIARIKARQESGLQKDYSADRKQFELFKQYTDPKLSQFSTKIEQDFPANMADYGSYIKQAAEKKGVRIIDVVPYEKRGKNYQWSFDEMIPGGLYFKPDVGFVYSRDPKENVLIEYDPRTFEEIRKIPLSTG